MRSEDLELAAPEAAGSAPADPAEAADDAPVADRRTAIAGQDLQHDVQVLRRQLAAYKHKLARISEVIRQDGRVDSGPGRPL
jgi:hypothetical protein